MTSFHNRLILLLFFNGKNNRMSNFWQCWKKGDRTGLRFSRKYFISRFFIIGIKEFCLTKPKLPGSAIFDFQINEWNLLFQIISSKSFLWHYVKINFIKTFEFWSKLIKKMCWRILMKNFDAFAICPSLRHLKNWTWKLL